MENTSNRSQTTIGASTIYYQALLRREDEGTKVHKQVLDDLDVPQFVPLVGRIAQEVPTVMVENRRLGDG